MVNLAVFFLTTLLLQADLSHGYTNACEWIGSWPFCNPDYCSAGFVDLGRLQVGVSELAYPGRVCLFGEKRLCCKKEIIKGDARKECHWTKGWDNVKKATTCSNGQIMLFKNYKTDPQMRCCDTQFFVDGFWTKTINY
ncbi:hypothetical protein PRIPAC_72333 [Pristionchus pacificus]|nr:hypothetical protein PRIPAC_72333 [Pristionchus pacificus]